MRVTVRSVCAEPRDYFVLMSEEAQPAQQGPAHARVFHDERLDQLRLDRVLVERTVAGRAIVFVRTDAHDILGGSQEGWFKTIKARLRVGFVHFSGYLFLSAQISSSSLLSADIEKSPAFWDEQLAWLASTVGAERVIVAPKEHKAGRTARQTPTTTPSPVEVIAPPAPAPGPAPQAVFAPAVVAAPPPPPLPLPPPPPEAVLAPFVADEHRVLQLQQQHQLQMPTVLAPLKVAIPGDDEDGSLPPLAKRKKEDEGK